MCLRELLNIFHANDICCHIITATDGVLSKLKVVGKDLSDYSLETVKIFLRMRGTRVTRFKHFNDEKLLRYRSLLFG